MISKPTWREKFEELQLEYLQDKKLIQDLRSDLIILVRDWLEGMDLSNASIEDLARLTDAQAILDILVKYFEPEK